MRFEIRKYFNLIFAILALLYLSTPYPYDMEILLVSSLILSVDVVVRSIRFRIRRNQLIELGEQETFHMKLIGFLLPIIFIILLFYVIPRFVSADILPERSEEVDSNFLLIALLPQLIQFIIGIFFKEMGRYLYLTDKGILMSMETKESYKWSDFNDYKVLASQKLLRFEKKNLKYLFISYHEEYFNKHREKILSVLDKNLKIE